MDDYGLIPNATGYQSALGNIQSNTVREEIHLKSNQTVQNIKNKNLTLQIASSGHEITAQNYKSFWYIHLVLFKENTMCLLWCIYMFYLKTKCSSVIGPQSTYQQVDRMLDIQRIEQSLVEAIHTIVQRRYFYGIEKGLDNSAYSNVKGIMNV